MDQQSLAKESLAKRIAGEIVLSNDAGKIIQKWRNIFKIPQKRLADEMKIMPSVISDYENGRRKSPGIKIIKRIVNSMITIDEVNGGKIILEYMNMPTKPFLSEAVLDLKEFSSPVSVKEFCSASNSNVVARSDLEDNKIYGYVVIDGTKAIVEISPMDLVKLYGYTNERALIFVKAHSGKSSMIALKVSNIKPGLVIFHGTDNVDSLAKRIGEVEGIPLAISNIKETDDLLSALKKNFN